MMWNRKERANTSKTTRNGHSTPKTKTVTLEVTFSQCSPAADGWAPENDDGDDRSFLRNIELCHLADWTVQNCSAVLANDTQSAAVNSDIHKREPKNWCVMWVVFTLTHLFFLAFAAFYDISGFSLELAVIRSCAGGKKSRLPPETSLVRIQDPLPSYSEGWKPVPPEYAKTYYADNKKQSHAFLRALHRQGYTRIQNFEKAHVIYSHQSNADWAKQVKLWQRFNFVPHQDQWKNAYMFHYHYKQWEQQTGQRPVSIYVPDTYLLTHFNKTNAKKRGSQDFDGNAFSGGQSKYDYNTHLVKQDINDFQSMLLLDNHNDMRDKASNTDRSLKNNQNLVQTFWLVKTDDRSDEHTVLAQVSDNRDLKRLASDKLKDLLEQDPKDKLSDSNAAEATDDGGDVTAIAHIASAPTVQTSRSFLQKYICNKILIDSKYSFSIRIFWAVVSLEPLIVLYHDGYIDGYRLEAPLAPQSTPEGHRIKTERNWEGRPDSFQIPFSEFQRALDESVSPSFPAGTATNHIRSQMKEALADFVRVMQNKAFKLPDGVFLTAENAYSLYCADFILDQSLDVWMVSPPKSGCNLDEDYYFRLDLHASVFQGLIDALEEVWDKQEKQELVMPLKKKGKWETVYGDGIRFQYTGYDAVNRTKSNQHDCLGVRYSVAI